jgi:alpha-D-ribose 1-methylphosphonate 5-triphosphate synthase subunit PhnG
LKYRWEQLKVNLTNTSNGFIIFILLISTETDSLSVAAEVECFGGAEMGMSTVRDFIPGVEGERFGLNEVLVAGQTMG